MYGDSEQNNVREEPFYDTLSCFAVHRSPSSFRSDPQTCGTLSVIGGNRKNGPEGELFVCSGSVPGNLCQLCGEHPPDCGTRSAPDSAGGETDRCRHLPYRGPARNAGRRLRRDQSYDGRFRKRGPDRTLGAGTGDPRLDGAPGPFRRGTGIPRLHVDMCGGHAHLASPLSGGA